VIPVHKNGDPVSPTRIAAKPVRNHIASLTITNLLVRVFANNETRN
jgi:hypothetical protein